MIRSWAWADTCWPQRASERVEPGNDLVPIARIFSLPELNCFVSALEAEGVLVFAGAWNHGQASVKLIALGGYLVRVPETQLEQALALITELRAETEPLAVSDSLQWGIGALFKFNLAMQMLYAGIMMLLGMAPVLAFLSLFAALMTPVPMTMPGDYRNRRGDLVQLR